MLATLFRRRPARPTRVPPGVRVYAIGDIHGCAGTLAALHAMIAADVADLPPAEAVLVYLGDYIDRGDDSRGVIEALIGPPPIAARRHLLRGNHEAMLLRFLDGDLAAGPPWFDYGGAATLLSYRVPVEGPVSREATLAALREALAARLPASHLAFLRGLETMVRIGDYVFVHAGVRPRIALDDQSADDLLWIRGAFLGSKADHGAVVVHGHSITPEVATRPNRIGIDTGAFATGVLTALVLEGEGRRLLQTRP